MPTTHPHAAHASTWKLLQHAARGKYFWLLVSILMTIIFAPMFQDYRIGIRIIDMLGGLILLAGLWAVGHSRRHLIISLTLLIPAAVINGPFYSPEVLWIVIAGHMLVLLFLFFVLAVMLGDVLTEPRVTADTLQGAICIYLLLALTWAVMFSLVAAMEPGAFAIIEPLKVTSSQLTFHRDGFGHVVYFSIITLTTLGYGDITPVASIARVLAALESMIGQVYLAILVARLVGMHIVGMSQPHRHGS